MTGLLLMGPAAATSAMAAGAVVVAPDRSVVYWTVHKPSGDIAAHFAMSHCVAQFGGGCFVDKTFSYGCLGVASAPGPHWGYAVRDTPGEARRAALDNCAQYSGYCRVKTVTCE
ncbi:MAG: DUF4189 domain-containing protein [Hyphomicrobiales bacterium]